jgi:hypothetical protein
VKEHVIIKLSIGVARQAACACVHRHATNAFLILCAGCDMSDDIDLSQYISKEQQAELIADQNKRKSRAKRPGQISPPKRSRGRPRAHTRDDDHFECDPEYPDQGDTRPATGQAWRDRLQKEEQAWQASHQANRQMAQQYAAYDRDCSLQVQVDAALHCATQSVAGLLHVCAVSIRKTAVRSAVGCTVAGDSTAQH